MHEVAPLVAGESEDEYPVVPRTPEQVAELEASYRPFDSAAAWRRVGHPGAGLAGDLFVDSHHHLWFCHGGTTWTRLT
jgi:hypothetical protein